MARLEDLRPGAICEGLAADGPATIVQVDRHGSGAVTVVYRDAAGALADRILLRNDEERIRLLEDARPWPLDADGAAFRLAAEAQRIRLAHLFDPYLAVTTSQVQALPHQITAVYGDMLPRLPLRFLLADDPGAGKTIMTGLLIKELLIRGDVRRCLVVCPGSLILQWQTELEEKFGLDFRLFSQESQERGNPFLRHDLMLARMDHLARNLDTFRPWLEQTEWDLVVVDEAHKMSLRWEGAEVRKTKRRLLGEALGAPQRTRHFLLLTATPHNGKDEEFYGFLGLLDADRFEGRVQGERRPDVADLMRRVSKEQLVRFDGTPLFPPRLAHTAGYTLSPPEDALYQAVTAYVRDQMQRADRLRAEGDARLGQIIGLALTILQRRLASSPEAIYRTLCRRKDRLEAELQEARRTHLVRSAVVKAHLTDDEHDEDDDTAAEREEGEEEVAAGATAARTVAELAAEVAALEGLIAQAAAVRQGGLDSKWAQLSTLLQKDPLMLSADGARHKLIIFTEHRDTLGYLADHIRDLLGRPEAVVTIQGGMERQARRLIEARFQQDPDTWVLVATDAAGEGINLQRAHLVVNYDLPWNPNRLEQRFGRVHRIGQEQACHMWSLLALGTREADVYGVLLLKLEAERHALPGYVFDVLGQAFREHSLRDLLIEAIRSGDDPAVRERLRAEVEQITDLDRIKALAAEQGLVGGGMDAAAVEEVRQRMLRAAAQRLQPHHIGSFFREALRLLGGRLHQREPGRYEVGHVPLEVRDCARALGARAPALERYERITFEPERVAGPPEAAFVCPGHGLFDAVLDLTLQRHQALLRRGAVLLDPGDWGERVRWLWYLEHEIACGSGRTVSQRVLFVQQEPDGPFLPAGGAPHLDLRPVTDAQRQAVEPVLSEVAGRPSVEAAVLDYAIAEVVPRHLEEVRAWHDGRLTRTMQAVQDRLTREISYWDRRAQDLREQERAGRQPRMNPLNAERRAKALDERLQRRLHELRGERDLFAKPPRLLGGALIVPHGLLARLGAGDEASPAHTRDTARAEALGMDAVLRHERALGNEPRDVSRARCGYDVESRTRDGDLRFVEVKARVEDADSVTVTRNEIMTALNDPRRFFLALVRLAAGAAETPVYLRRPFGQEPEFGVESVTYRISDLLQRGEPA